MKLKTIAKFSFLVIFLYLLIISTGLIFNFNYILLASINTFTPIHISKANNFSISYKPLSLQFDEFSFSYDRQEIDIRNGKVLMHLAYPVPELSEISLEKLTIEELSPANSSGASDKRNALTINFLDYLPDKIIDSYAIPVLYISDFTYTSDGRPIHITDLNLKKKTSSHNKAYLESLFTLSDAQNNSFHISANLENSNHIVATIKNNLDTDIGIDLSLQPKSNSKILIVSKINGSYDDTSKNILNNLFFKKDFLNKVNGSFILQLKTSLNNSIDFSQSMATQIDTLESSFSGKQFTALNIPAINSIDSDISFALNIQSDGQDFSSTLTIPQTLEMKIKPDTKYKFFKTKRTLDYLSDFPLLVSVPSGSTAQLTKNKFSLPENIEVRWSKKGNPAYLILLFNAVNGDINNNKITDLDLKYYLSGRWNKYFSSEHNNHIHISDIHSLQNFKLEAKGKENRLHTDFTLALNKQADAISGNYLLSTHDWKHDTKHLDETMAYWNKDIKLLDGLINADGSFSANNILDDKKRHITYKAHLDIKKLNIDNDGTIINNFHMSGDFNGKDYQLSSTHALPTYIDNIDTGFLITQLAVDSDFHFNFKGDSYIDFSQLKANLLGGYLETDNFRMNIPYNTDHDKDQPYEAKFQATVKDIQLKQVLALMENPEIQGDGPLHGDLPITVNEKSILIDKGQIFNTTPGVLSYNPDKDSRHMLSQNPQMKLLVDVLGHLDYSKLKAKVNLDNTGILSIQGELMGINKNYKSGAQVSFNPNIELNFTDLIKSLQISDTISRTLDERVNEKTLD